MKEKTKQYKEAARHDLKKIASHNNSRWERMTDEEKKQSVSDKINYYALTWEYNKLNADTPAQKKWCDVVLREVYAISRT